MNAVLVPIMLLAAFGFLLSVAAHLAALAHIRPAPAVLPWALHIGIFVVWIPTVLVAIRTTGGTKRDDFWAVVLSGCPFWMRRLLWVVVVYALFNFVWFASTTSAHPKLKDGASPSVIRGFSGHWMVFYGAAFAVLYSACRQPDTLRERRCTNGHRVVASDKFCPRCGRPLDGSASRV